MLPLYHLIHMLATGIDSRDPLRRVPAQLGPSERHSSCILLTGPNVARDRSSDRSPMSCANVVSMDRLLQSL